MSYSAEFIIVLWLFPVLMFIVIPLFLSVLVLLKKLLLWATGVIDKEGTTERREESQKQVGERGHLLSGAG